MNVVSPGPVDTSLFRSFPEAGRGAFNSKTIIKRAAEPHEIAQTYLGVLKDRTVFGQVLVSDGGYLLAP